MCMLQLLLPEKKYHTRGIEDLNWERLLDIRLGKNKIYKYWYLKSAYIKITVKICALNLWCMTTLYI